MGELMIGLYVFVLATLAGREVITKVPPTLHTPLMSGANAISGIAYPGGSRRNGAAPGKIVAAAFVQPIEFERWIDLLFVTEYVVTDGESALQVRFIRYLDDFNCRHHYYPTPIQGHCTKPLVDRI